MLRFIWHSLPALLIGFPGQRPGGLALTLSLSAMAVALGGLVAIISGTARASHRIWLRRLSGLYVNIFRGLPLLMLLLIIHQVVGGRRFGLDLSPLSSALIALTLYTSAYMTEVIRSGLLAVPEELTDSARSLGASQMETYLRIRLPFVFRVTLPALTGQAITVLKDSSIVVVLGVADLMTIARATLGSSTQNLQYWMPMYLTLGALYGFTAFGLSQLAAAWERRLQVSQLSQLTE
jgi:His/Glu/Gln/Arg/opine family amino acid ABC transporter permease subunit